MAKALTKLKKQWLKETRKTRPRPDRLRRLLPLVLLATVAAMAGFLYLHSSSPATELSRADRSLLEGDAEAALTHLQRVYERQPEAEEAPRALYRAGLVLHRQLKRYREAILLLLQLEQHYPEAPEVASAQQEIAEIYKYRLQDHGRAISTYQRLLDTAPEQGDRFQYEIADGYFQLGNYEQSRIEFELLLKRWPGSIRSGEALLSIGQLYQLEGSEAAAEATFRRLLAEQPASGYGMEAQLALAGLHEERGELRAALALLEPLAGRFRPEELLQRRIEQIRQRLAKRGLE